MIDYNTLTGILSNLFESVPIRIWAYSTSDDRIEKYIEGFGTNPIYDKLDALPDNSYSYNYVIKIGMGN